MSCVPQTFSGRAAHPHCYLQELGSLHGATGVFLTSNCQTGLKIMKLDKTEVGKRFITTYLGQGLNFITKDNTVHRLKRQLICVLLENTTLRRENAYPTDTRVAGFGSYSINTYCCMYENNTLFKRCLPLCAEHSVDAGEGRETRLHGDSDRVNRGSGRAVSGHRTRKSFVEEITYGSVSGKTETTIKYINYIYNIHCIYI